MSLATHVRNVRILQEILLLLLAIVTMVIMMMELAILFVNHANPGV